MGNRFKFSKTELEGLKVPAEGRATYYDSEVPKLAVRVTAAGARSFYVVKRDGSKMSWVKVGRFPDTTVEQARKEAAKVLGAFAAGINPAEKKREEKQKIALGDAFEQYMRLWAGPHGVKTAADLRAIWERCVGTLPDLPAKKHGRKRAKHPGGVDWSARKLDTITNAEVRALHSSVAETTPVLANRVLEIISTVFNRAKEWGYRGGNPADGIKPFGEIKRDRFIRQDELPRFFTALAADTSTDFRHFVLLSLLTGQRRNNILAARWEEFDLSLALWRVPYTKNGEPVQVPLVPEAVEVLKERKPKANGFIFPADSKTGHVTPPKARWAALLKRAKIADLTIHDMRRSLGSWQAINGASLAIIGKSLGHKSADATMIYARLSMDPVRASVATATSAMLVAAGVKALPAPPVELDEARKKKTRKKTAA